MLEWRNNVRPSLRPCSKAQKSSHCPERETVKVKGALPGTNVWDGVHGERGGSKNRGILMGMDEGTIP